MIARVLGGGRSFKGSISYNVMGKNGRARLAWMEFRNLPTRSPQVAWCMMAATASTSVSNTKEAVYHFSVSCDPDDPVDGDALRRIAGRTIHDLGLQEYEVAVFCHNDRSHPHLHFIANRVHPERGTLWSKWRDCYRLEYSMRAQERELGLRVVPGWLVSVPGEAGITRGGKEAPARKPRPAPVRGDAAFLQDVIDRATPLVEGAQSWAELDRRLAEQGLSLFVKGGGFRVTDGRRQVKASEVGRAFSRRNLEKRFGSYPDYRTRVAAASVVMRATPVETRSNEHPHDVLPSPVPAPAPELPRPAADPRIGTGQEPQIGFLRAPSAPAAEEIGAVVERGPELQPVNRDRRFLREVKKQATPVLAGAQSWAELERALDGLGLSLHVKGGGFVISDGQREAKASDVGRAFSRGNLEKRLGVYGEYRALQDREDVPPQGDQLLLDDIEGEPATEATRPASPRLDAITPQTGVVSLAPASGGPQLELPFTAAATATSVPASSAAPAADQVEPPHLGVLSTANLTKALQHMPHVTEEKRPTDDAAGPMQLDLHAAVEVRPLGTAEATGAAAAAPGGLDQPGGGTQFDLPLLDAVQPDGPPVPHVVGRVHPAEPVQTEFLLAGEVPAQPSRSQPTDRPRPPAREVAAPRPAPVTQPATSPARAHPPQPPATTGAPASAPRPSRPLTERERYRDARRSFGRALAKLYVNPHVARRRFTNDVSEHSGDAVDQLRNQPERYGAVRSQATPDDAATAARMGSRYAEFYLDRARAGLRSVAERYGKSHKVERADLNQRRVEELAEEANSKLNRLLKHGDQIQGSDDEVRRIAEQVYKDPQGAIEAFNTRVAERQTEALRSTLTDLEVAPKQFGALQTDMPGGVVDWVKETLGSGRVGNALGHVRLLSKHLEYRHSLGEPPSHAEIAQAREAVRAAEKAVDEAREARKAISDRKASALLDDATRKLQPLLKRFGTRPVQRQLAPMLPTGVTIQNVIELVRMAIQVAEGPER